MTLCLIAALAFEQSDDDPLATLREKVAKAETLRIEYDVRQSGAKRPAAAIRGSIFLRGKGGLRTRIEWLEGPQAGEFKEAIFDGRSTSHFGSAASTGGDITPESLERCREALAILPLAFTFEIVDGRSGGAPKPEITDVKDCGVEKHGGLDRRVVRYALKRGVHIIGTVAVHLDPVSGVPSRRDVSFGIAGVTLVETYAAFALGEPLPPEAFVYATRGRLAAAQTAQLGRAVDLYQHYTGRRPPTLDALITRPDDLDPAVFWPEGGFWLGPRVPKDPWGRPFAYRSVGDGGSMIMTFGEDGDSATSDGDYYYTVARPAGERIAAPTRRLRDTYQTCRTLHLTAAAARAFHAAYGAPASDLRRPPAPPRPAPDGGWLPDGPPPADAWGEPLELRPVDTLQLVQVKDVAKRSLRPSDLTAEERAALRAAARVPPTPEQRAAVRSLLARMAGDDPEDRDRAEADLRPRALELLPLLDEALRTEGDAETRARLQRIRAATYVPAPSWRLELEPLEVVALPDEALDGHLRIQANEVRVKELLRTIAQAQADFRGNDRDLNRTQDYWTGDVSGLFALQVGGRPLALIDPWIARADAAALPAGSARGRLGPQPEGGPLPVCGYFLRAMTTERLGDRPEPYARDTEGEPNLGPYFNYSKFGLCAYPAEHGVTGQRTFIMNEGLTIYAKDAGGAPILEWPSEEELFRWPK